MAQVSGRSRPGAGFRNRTMLVSALLGALVLILVASITVIPILFVVVGGLEPGAWRAALVESALTRKALGCSFLLALRAPIAAGVGFLLAWLLIRVDVPGRSWIEFAFWVAFFMPTLPITLGWTLLLDPNYGLINSALQAIPILRQIHFDIYSLGGIFWVHLTASSVPVMVILLGPAIRQLDASLEEASRICGSSPLQAFRRITMPILAPAILTGALATFMRGLEAFEVEKLLGRPVGIFVYSTRIHDLILWDPPLFGQAMAVSTLMLAILLVIAITYQFLSRDTAHATIMGRGTSYRPILLGNSRYWISGGLVLLTAFTVLLPVVMLVAGSLMTLFGFFNLPQTFTLNHWRTVLADRLFLSSLKNSLMVATGSAAIGTLVYSVLAYVIVRTRLFGRRAIDILAWLPWSVPGILLGMAFLWLFLSTPGMGKLYGSIGSLIFVLMIAQMPLGVQMMKTSIGQIHRELELASQICGAGSFTTFVRIVLPLVRPMLVSIFVLIFIAGMRDISTIIFLVRGSTQTLSTLMLQYATYASTEAAAVVGVITSAVVIVVAMLARAIGLQVGRNR